MALSLVRIGSLLVLWQIASCEKTETAEVEANQSGQYNNEKNKKISQAEITQVGALDAAELNEDEKDEVEDAEKYAVEVTSHGDLGDEELTRLADKFKRTCCFIEWKDPEHDKFSRYECMEKQFCKLDKQLASVVTATDVCAGNPDTCMESCAKAKEEGGYGQDCAIEELQKPLTAKKSKWTYYPDQNTKVCCGIRGYQVWRSEPKCRQYQLCKKNTHPERQKINHGENHVVLVDASKCDWKCESR